MSEEFESLNESAIIRRIGELVAKLVTEEVTDKERTELYELSELRSRLMHPPLSGRSEVRHRRLG